MHIAIYDDKHTLSQHAAEYIMRIANESIDLHGHFTIALTGGTTPGEVYSLIGSEPFRSQIDWQLVHIFWGDERCVPHNSPESNFYLAQEALLQKISIPESQIHPMPADQLNRDAASQAYTVEMQNTFGTDGIPSFDLIHLGMGPEGHTASLFPHQTSLHEKHRLVMPVDCTPNKRRGGMDVGQRCGEEFTCNHVGARFIAPQGREEGSTSKRVHARATPPLGRDKSGPYGFLPYVFLDWGI